VGVSTFTVSEALASVRFFFVGSGVHSLIVVDNPC
jgi:hypothetical protein